MALTKTVEFKGITVSDGYIRVSGVTVLPGNKNMEFGVHLMAARDQPPLDSHMVYAAYKLEGGNPVMQAYMHLKTLDKYAGAGDC